jgi:hypothetical protein
MHVLIAPVMNTVSVTTMRDAVFFWDVCSLGGHVYDLISFCSFLQEYSDDRAFNISSFVSEPCGERLP